MWEFSEATNADMGHVLNYPHVARMRDGTLVSILGNGYDSKNGQAKLFLINLQTGAVHWEQSVGAAGANGLSQPNFTLNKNREVTAIYAGDLKGNLWKFDVDNTDKALWKVAFGSSPGYSPMFTGSTNQPITVMPEITFHPSGGTLVSFGTGKLFETEDTEATVAKNVNLNTQAIYGIWDKPGETAGFSGNTSLVQQEFTTAVAADASTNVTGTTTKTVDWTTKRGWYLNLGVTNGERVNVNPQQVNSVLLVVSNKPEIDPCSSGGTSRLFTLDPITGGAPNFAVFDSNGVGGITSADKGFNVKFFSVGVLSLPTLQSKKTGSDVVTTESTRSRGQTGARLGGVEDKPGSPTDCAQWLLAGGSDTSIAGLDIATCASGNPRISWRQLK
jgi:type IV pilus assembly protein PilY1